MNDRANARAYLPLLRAVGISVEGDKEPYLVGGLYMYWPSTDTWRRVGGRRAGYGWRALAQAVKQARANAEKGRPEK